MELHKLLNKQKPNKKQIYLFHGNNSFLSYREAQQELESAEKKLKEQEKPFETLIFDATTAEADKIVAEIETPSLFQTHKLILVKRMLESKDKDKLTEMLLEITDSENLNPNVNLYIWENKKLRSNMRIVKAVKNDFSIYESPKLNKRSFKTWAKKELRSENIKINRSAIHLLSERVNYDAERLTRELSKIKLLGKNKIVDEDIEKVCPDTLEHTIWDLIDHINKGQQDQAGRKLDLIIQQGKDPFYILFMLVRNFRIILLSKILLEKNLSSSQIASKIKAPPFTINKIKRLAQKVPMARLKTTYEKLNNIDYLGKTGQIDVELALNILLSVI